MITRSDELNREASLILEHLEDTPVNETASRVLAKFLSDFEERPQDLTITVFSENYIREQQKHLSITNIKEVLPMYTILTALCRKLEDQDLPGRLSAAFQTPSLDDVTALWNYASCLEDIYADSPYGHIMQLSFSYGLMPADFSALKVEPVHRGDGAVRLVSEDLDEKRGSGTADSISEAAMNTPFRKTYESLSGRTFIPVKSAAFSAAFRRFVSSQTTNISIPTFRKAGSAGLQLHLLCGFGTDDLKKRYNISYQAVRAAMKNLPGCEPEKGQSLKASAIVYRRPPFVM